LGKKVPLNSLACVAGSLEDLEEKIARLHDTARLLGLVRLGQESSPGGSLEDFADTLAGTSRAFKVFVGTNLLSDLFTL
jgi:hypothetical protein